MRKTLCVILIIMLLTSFCINIYAQDTENTREQQTEEEKQQLEELRTQDHELQQQVQENINKLEIIQTELTQNLIEIQEIDTNIEESEEKLNKLNEEIDELDAKIRNSEKDVQAKQKEYNAQKKATDERLIALCEQGDLRYLEVLLGSKSIEEFISNYFMMAEIHSNDVELLEKTNSQREELEKITKELEGQRSIINEKRKTQQTDSQLLENAKTARQIQVSNLSEYEQNIQLQIDEYKIQIAQIENEIRILAKLESFGEDYIGGEMAWPIPGHTIITSQYGMRTHPITGVYKLHTGTDVSAPIGTDFLAMANGVVTKAEYNLAYGNMVLIDHGGGVQTLYAHGSEIIVGLGQLVAQGEPVLKVGSTGYSTGPHAHFEIRINGEPVNPLDYVEPK